MTKSNYTIKTIFILSFCLCLNYLSVNLKNDIKSASESNNEQLIIQEKNNLKVVSLDLKPYLNSLPKSLTYDQEVDFFSKHIAKAYGIKEDVAKDYASWILQASTYSEAPELMLAGLIMTESTYRGNVSSSVGAVGPTQIRMKYWRDLCPFGDKNEKENIICGGMILTKYYNKNCNQDWSCALQLYNVGPTNFKQEKYKKAGKRYLSKISRYTAMIEKEHQKDQKGMFLDNFTHKI